MPAAGIFHNSNKKRKWLLIFELDPEFIEGYLDFIYDHKL